MKWSVGVLALVLAAVLTAVAVAVTPTLSRAQYLVKLRAANAASAKVDNAAGAAAGSKTATPTEVRAWLRQDARPGAHGASRRRLQEVARAWATLTVPL